MSNKVILIVLDGLNYQVGRDCMGFTQGLCEQGLARLYKMQCELPSMSRPLYECILTGVVPAHSGIVHNHITRRSTQQSIFSLSRAAGKRTAAAAYHWFSELYNRTPWDAIRDRYTHDESQLIQHGLFYCVDSYPDCHLFNDAEHLRQQHDPDFLLVHPMNIDDAGHRAGVDSAHYRNTTRHTDMALSEYLPIWMAAGYQILITSDHGMNTDKSHGGLLAEEREVPLWVIGDQFSFGATDPLQTELCGTVCQLLNVPHDKPLCRELLTAPRHTGNNC